MPKRPALLRKQQRRASCYRQRQTLLRRWLLLLLFSLVAQHQGVLSMDLDSYIRDELGLDLTSMSERQLEKLCEDRGYEVAKDEMNEETGKPLVFTHQDYVDAARQCLSIQWFAASEVANSQAMTHKLRKNLDETLKENEKLKRELAIAVTANNGVLTPAMKNQMKAMKDLVAATLDLFFGVLPKPFRRILINLKGDMETALQTVGRMLGAVVGLAFRTLKDGVEDEMGHKKDQLEL